MHSALRYSPLLAILLVGACTTMPTGPSMLVLPGTGKNFDQFRGDDMQCREFASAQVGGVTPSQTQADSGVKSAVVGTAIGAAAGAVANGSSGAGWGAGVGLLVGAIAGANAADSSGYGVQQRYDYGYEQCMYARGHKIPVTGRFASTIPAASAPAAPQPGAYYPPPPPDRYVPPPQ